MQYFLAGLVMLAAVPAWGYDGLLLPTVDFSATAVQEAGAFESRQTIHYSSGMLRIDSRNGFSATILNLKTQTQYLLMVNQTYLMLPMDDELFRHFIARAPDMTGATRVGTQQLEGRRTTNYAFGNDGGLNAAGHYWLSDTNIMLRREYDDGILGQSVHHLEFLTDLTIQQQPADLFKIPATYKPAQ